MHLDLQTIARLAAQMLGQRGDFAQLLGFAQALGRGHALHTNLHGCNACIGRSLHAAFNAHITAQRPGLYAGELKPGLRKQHIAAHLAERRDFRHQLQRIACQCEVALHLGAVHMLGRQLELEAELGVARGLAVI